MRNRRGFTLLELACTLALAGLLLLLATPAWTHARDALATRAARDHLLQSIALARALAPLHGGAELVLEPAAAALSVRTAGRVHESAVLRDRYRVSLVVEGSTQPEVALRFDALGIGRLANRTIALSRGRARAGVSLSMYGRPRAW